MRGKKPKHKRHDRHKLDSVACLTDAVEVYELAEFGTVAPDDTRVVFAKLCKLAEPVMAGEATEYSVADLLLLVLVAGKRFGHDIPTVAAMALQVATDRQPEADAVRARQSDDGAEIGGEG